VISAISFDVYHGAKKLTNRILLGTMCGCVYETELDTKQEQNEPLLKLLLKSESISRISGLHMENNVAESSICVLLVADSPNIAIYNFSGGPTCVYFLCVCVATHKLCSLDAVFAPHNSPHLIFESATSNVNAKLCYSTQIYHGDNGCSVAVKTEHGLVHANLAPNVVNTTYLAVSSHPSLVGDFPLNSFFICSAEYLQSNEGITHYPRKQVLLSFLMRGPHFILMYHDAIVLVNKFNSCIVEEIIIKDEVFQGFCGGNPHGSTWLYTESSLYQFSLAGDDQVLSPTRRNL